MNGLVVFSTFFNLSLNLAIRSLLLFGNNKVSCLALVYFISERGQQFQTKLLLLQGWKLVSDVENPNLDQVERGFCSARQAYAHAQQEEVTEERDLRPNSQEVC